MEEERILTPDPVARKNLAALSERLSRGAEERISELSALVKEAVHDLLADGEGQLSVYDMITAFADAFRTDGGENTVHTQCASFNRARVGRFLRALGSYDRAVLADLLTEELCRVGTSVREEDFLLCAEHKPWVAYVRNSLSDEAYEVFSEELTDPHVRYVASFREAVTLLKNGEVGYCLLPLEEKGMRLPTVEQLLYHNDLRIASVTPVFGFDGDADLTYALVSLTVRPAAYVAEDDRYLEIRVPKEAISSLGELLLSAGTFGDSVYRINTMTFDGAGGKQVFYDVVFRNTGASFTSLLAFFTLFVPEFTPVGLYKNLES